MEENRLIQKCFISYYYKCLPLYLLTEPGHILLYVKVFNFYVNVILYILLNHFIVWVRFNADSQSFQGYSHIINSFPFPDFAFLIALSAPVQCQTARERVGIPTLFLTLVENIFLVQLDDGLWELYIYTHKLCFVCSH